MQSHNIEDLTPQRFKKIHLGKLIEKRVSECGIQMDRICNFIKCKEEDIVKMYQSENLDTNILLLWSKLLEYDFFRIYSQHLILYAPPSSEERSNSIKQTSLPIFRKNIYTKEIIDFILEEIENGTKTKSQIISEYGIPKTTLYKWILKYNK